MKNLKISTKLASAVLGKEVTKCSLINKTRNSINITYFEDKEDFNPICREWNIYELAHKCKEWALDKGYTIESHTNRSFISKYNREYFSVAKIFKETDSMRINTIDESTEIEAIIKACEWILENIK